MKKHNTLYSAYKSQGIISEMAKNKTRIFKLLKFNANSEYCMLKLKERLKPFLHYKEMKDGWEGC